MTTHISSLRPTSPMNAGTFATSRHRWIASTIGRLLWLSAWLIVALLIGTLFNYSCEQLLEKLLLW